MTTRTDDRQFVPALHGLRGLMALWVVSYHTTPTGLGPLHVTNYGYLAVDVFFILSGYVLMQAHAARFGRPTWAATRLFWRRRWWRIYPLCLVSVVLSIALFNALHDAWPGLDQIGRILADSGRMGTAGYRLERACLVAGSRDAGLCRLSAHRLRPGAV